MKDFRYLWSQLHRYISHVEASIASSDAAVALTADQRTKLLQKPELEVEFNVGYEEFIEATDVFPQVLRRSTFVFLITLFESAVNDVCRRVQLHFDSRFSVYDLQGRGVARAAEYIRLLVGVNPKQLASWQELQELKNIRDALVHNNGVIRASQLDQPTARFARSHPLISLIPMDGEKQTPQDFVIIVKQGLCEEAQKKVESFVDALIKQLAEQGIKADKNGT